MLFSDPKNIPFLILISAAGIYGITEAISLAWVTDDAFIPFRYAKNLLNGHGLVYNVGERVEGYTNFLWTILIALGMKINIEPEFFTKALGIASYITTVVIFICLSFNLLYSRDRTRGVFMPLTAIVLFLHHDYHIFATGGLETSWFAMLLSLGFAILLLAGTDKSFFYAGLVLVLASVSRPDGLIFFAVCIFYIIIAEKNKSKKLFYFILPLIILFIPYWISRYLYYGYPFPNTYYAKSANLPYYSQGLLYLWLYLKTYYVLLLIPLFAGLLLPSIIKTFSETGRISDDYKPVLLSLFFFVPYSFYIVRLGGDFMFARFLIPVTPFCFFFMESSLNTIVKNNMRRIFIFFLIVIAVVFHWNQYKEKKMISGIAYEHRWYPPSKIEQQKKTGGKLKKYLKDRRINVLYEGRQAMLAYYAGFPTAIDRNGLTDEYIAHLPLEKRGRPGHEKHPPFDYLLERKVHFFFKPAKDKLRRISFDGVEAGIIVYDNDIMKEMKKYNEVRFIDIPSYLDGYIKKIDDLSLEQIEKDYLYFKEYYFDHNDDRKREDYFIKRL